jgi:hypothetical protein
MVTRCQKCGRMYDDAEQWTICPHAPLWASHNNYCPEHDLVNCQMPYHYRPKEYWHQDSRDVNRPVRDGVVETERRERIVIEEEKSQRSEKLIDWVLAAIVVFCLLVFGVTFFIPVPQK